MCIRDRDKNRRRIVASRKEILKEEAIAKRKEKYAAFEPGQRVKGIVRRLTDFGAFTDIGGVDGLIPVSYTHLFRAVALKAIQAGVDTKDETGLAALLQKCQLDIRVQEGQQHTYLDGVDVSTEIRAQEVGQGASDVGTLRCVRELSLIHICGGRRL